MRGKAKERTGIPQGLWTLGPLPSGPRRPAVPRFECFACGTTFKAWAAAERHADSEHHHRLQLLLQALRHG